jgi:hypothetical protein
LNHKYPTALVQIITQANASTAATWRRNRTEEVYMLFATLFTLAPPAKAPQDRSRRD